MRTRNRSILLAIAASLPLLALLLADAGQPPLAKLAETGRLNRIDFPSRRGN